jgi:hypothetical protein
LVEIAFTVRHEVFRREANVARHPFSCAQLLVPLLIFRSPNGRTPKPSMHVIGIYEEFQFLFQLIKLAELNARLARQSQHSIIPALPFPDYTQSG